MDRGRQAGRDDGWIEEGRDYGGIEGGMMDG